MATVTVVRYKRRKRIGDEKSPMVYALKLKSGEAKIYSIETLAREIESIGSLSVEDVSHVMKSFVRAMKKVLVAGDKVKVDGLGIFYTTLTCPGVEQEKDCTVKNISRVNLRFKVIPRRRPLPKEKEVAPVPRSPARERAVPVAG